MTYYVSSGTLNLTKPKPYSLACYVVSSFIGLVALSKCCKINAYITRLSSPLLTKMMIKDQKEIVTTTAVFVAMLYRIHWTLRP